MLKSKIAFASYLPLSARWRKTVSDTKDRAVPVASFSLCQFLDQSSSREHNIASCSVQKEENQVEDSHCSFVEFHCIKLRKCCCAPRGRTLPFPYIGATALSNHTWSKGLIMSDSEQVSFYSYESFV